MCCCYPFLSLPVVLDDGARKYVWGLGLAYAVDTSGAIEVFHTDGLGSVRAITDASGTVTRTYLSDEFGNLQQTGSTSTQPFQFTGQQRDAESGFVYLRARMYEPQLSHRVHLPPIPLVCDWLDLLTDFQFSALVLEKAQLAVPHVDEPAAPRSLFTHDLDDVHLAASMID